MSGIATAMFGPLSPTEKAPELAHLRRKAIDAVQTASATAQGELASVEQRGGDPSTPQLTHWRNICATFESAMADMPVIDKEPLVVLLGRTQAGKSTLFRYLTGSTSSELGKGGQRTTRSVHRAPCALAGERIVISDTPGVGAKDGANDIRIALEEARRADVLIWVATTSSLQEQTREALDLVASWGTPLLLVVNCLEDLTDARAREIFLQYPSRQPVRVLASEPGHLARARRTLDDHGQAPLTTIAIHADAARLSLGMGADSQELFTASGVAELLSALRSQLAGRASAYRAMTICDTARKAFVDAARYSEGVRKDLADGLATSEAALEDLDQRAQRAIEDAAALTDNEVRQRLSRLNDWADRRYADDEHELERAWKATSNSIASDLDQIMTTNVKALSDRLEGLASDVWSAWERTIPRRQGRGPIPKSMGDLNPTWLEPAAKTGAGVIGLGIMFAIGGPAGLVVAALATAALERLSSWIFGGRRAQLRRRRESLNQQVLQLRDGFREEAMRAWAKAQTACEEELNKHRALVRGEHAAARQQIASLESVAQQSRISVAQLDHELTLTLMRLSGHAAIARSVRQVHRSPGSMTAVGLSTDMSVHESYLRPPPLADHARFYTDGDGDETTLRAVAHLWGLTPDHCRVHDCGGRVVVRVGSPDAAARRERTRQLVESCVGRPIQIETERIFGHG